MSFHPKLIFYRVWALGKKFLDGDWLNGRALPWGGRDSGFDSRVPDVLKSWRGIFCFPIDR